MSARRAALLTALSIALCFSGRDAWAHGGNPAVAFVVTPTCNATVAQGECYKIRWRDTDVPIITGTASVELFAIRKMPPTFAAGTVPEELERDSIPIVDGIREANRDNVWCWDTTNVEPGTYFIWSRLVEPAIEMSLRIISWAPGTLAVVAPGGEPDDSIFFVKPDSPFRFGDHDAPLQWCGRGPPGSTVKIEATPNRQQEDNLDLVADGLPIDGMTPWLTNCLYEGDWSLRTTITRPNGESLEAWSRYFLLVTHPFADRDSGMNEGCYPDAGPDPADAGVVVDDAGAIAMKEPGGCGCNGTRGHASAIAFLLIPAGIIALRFRRRSSR